MEMGDVAPHLRPPSPPASPTAFFSGLLNKASESISFAHRTGNEIVSSATVATSNAFKVVGDASNTAVSAVRRSITEGSSATGINGNIGASTSNQRTDQSPNAGTTPIRSTPDFPRTTKLVKTFHTNYQKPILLITSPTLTVITEIAAFAITSSASRPQQYPFNIMYDEAGRAVISSQAATASTPQLFPTSRPVRALCAVQIPSTSNVITAHDDGAIRLLSIQQGVTVLRSTDPDSSRANTIRLMPNDASTLLVGLVDGSVLIMDITNFTTETTTTPSENFTPVHRKVLPPEICRCVLGVEFHHSPVRSLLGISIIHDNVAPSVTKHGSVLVGYEDGPVCASDLNGKIIGFPFMAHAKQVSSLLCFFNALAVTIGSAADSSIAVFDIYSGRCLLRQVLTYGPTCLVPVSRSKTFQPADGEVCPSETTFLVGGVEGQIDIFRIAVLGPQRIDLRLTSRISERLRGKRRAVLHVEYDPEKAIITALSVNGEVRQWHVSQGTAAGISLLDEGTTRTPSFTEKNIVEAAEQDFYLPTDARVRSVGGVVQAQDVLAGILEDEAVAETTKDSLATEFQSKQSELFSAISQADAELRRARRRIIGMFGTGLKVDEEILSVVERRMVRAAKREAALLLEISSRNHAENLGKMQQATVQKLKAILTNALRSIPPGHASAVQMLP